MITNFCNGMTRVIYTRQKLTKTNVMAGNFNSSVGLRSQFESDCREKRSLSEENESSTEPNPEVSIYLSATRRASCNQQIVRLKKKNFSRKTSEPRRGVERTQI